jgi:hypothetical protein
MVFTFYVEHWHLGRAATLQYLPTWKNSKSINRGTNNINLRLLKTLALIGNLKKKK